MRNAVYLNSCSRASFYTVNGLPFTILLLSEKLIHPSILTTTRDICVTVCLNKEIFLIHYKRVQTWFHMLIAALWTELDEKKADWSSFFFFKPRLLSTTKNNYFSQLPRYNWLLLFYLIYVRIIITVIILDYFMHNKWTQTVCGVISMLGYVPW